MPAFGQEFRSTISGHILDATGAVVPAAKIQAVNLSTDEATNASSDGTGTYSVPFLRPGDYKLTVSAPGFKQFVQDHVRLEAAKVVGIEVRLEVGAVTDSVEVTADGLELETQSASRGGVVSNQQISELPLNARNPFMLGAMMSGVTFNGAAIWQRPFDNGAIAQWSINGSRDSSAEFFLDGASNNAQMGGNNIAYVPIVDAVQEFNVMTNMYNAEYGHTGGGVMNVVLKSGTTKHHVTAWEFLRRTPLDANTFQNNAIVASANNPKGGAPRPDHYLDQYGWQFEGPVLIPKLLKKDAPVKLFYLGSYEGYREGTPNPLNVSYPEAEMRNGDFSKLYTSLGPSQPITVYNPFNMSLNAAGNAVRQPFPNNIIPKSMINPIALEVTKYMPLPNQIAPAGSRYSTSNLLLPGYSDQDKFYNLILKFDFNIGNKHRAFFRHGSNDRTEDRASNGIDNKPGTDGQQPFQRINDAYVADWTMIATPTLIFDVKASFNRFIEKGFGRANEGFDVSSFGLPKDMLSQLPSPVYFGRWNVAGYASMGRSQSNNFSNTYQLQGSMTKVAGKHTMKAGADVRQINYLIQNTGDILSFSGDTQWTQQSNVNGTNTMGDGYATFLLGIVSGSSNFPLFPWWKQSYSALYFHDDWKVSRRLTVNLGLRYDITPFAHEKWNRQNGTFDTTQSAGLTIPDTALAALRANNVPDSQIGNLANLKGGLTFAGVNGVGSTPARLNKKNFGPRVGFAYQLRDKLVIRGGFGLYYADPNNDIFKTSGFSTSTSITNSLDGGRTPIPNILSSPYPNGITRPTGSRAGARTFDGQNPSFFAPTALIPKVWSFSLGFEYQLNQFSKIEATYVGSRSYDQTMQKDLNLPSLDFRKLCNIQEGGSPTYCNQNVPNPFKGIPAFLGTSSYTSDTISRFNLARPFPQFSGNLTGQGRNDSYITYDSLQVNYNIRMRGGLLLLGNYTFSKQIEEWGFTDPYKDVYQKGLYSLDRPHILKATAVWQLPFGSGQKFGANSNKFTRSLISGWSWNSTFTDPLKGFPSDLPGNVIQIGDSLKPLKDGSGNLVKDAQGTAVWSGTSDWKAYQVRLWNPCVMRQNDDGSIAAAPQSVALGCGALDSGNYAWFQTAGFAPRYTPNRSGQIRRQHAFYLDTSLTKETKVTERLRFQLGVEAFNVMNHNYYGRDNVNTDPTSTTFGLIRPSTVSTQNILPRQIQIRIKLFF